MDKEMLAKVNEILKANGRRELTLAETEQVVGGDTQFCCYVRDGEYYIKSAALGNSEMTLHEFGQMLWTLYDLAGADATIAFLNEVAPNPHNEELIRVYKPWGVVDHYQRRVNGNNPYFI